MIEQYPIILCASGNSVPFLNSQYYRTKCGLSSELVNVLKSNISIGLNWFFKYGYRTTFNSWADWQWYIWTKEQTKNIPLMIGNYDPSLKSQNVNKLNDNTLLLKSSNGYNGKLSLEKGVFCRQLVGIWALSLAVSLGFKEIYLLGYDCGEVNGQTHFYQGVIDVKKTIPIYIKGKRVENREVFRGIGKYEDGKRTGRYKTGTYNNKEINKRYFDPFLKEKDVKIYNVSPESAITSFEKIDYDIFYNKVKGIKIDQDKVREEIKRITNERRCDFNR